MIIRFIGLIEMMSNLDCVDCIFLMVLFDEKIKIDCFYLLCGLCLSV